MPINPNQMLTLSRRSKQLVPRAGRVRSPTVREGNSREGSCCIKPLLTRGLLTPAPTGRVRSPTVREGNSREGSCCIKPLLTRGLLTPGGSPRLNLKADVHRAHRLGQCVNANQIEARLRI